MAPSHRRPTRVLTQRPRIPGDAGAARCRIPDTPYPLGVRGAEADTSRADRTGTPGASGGRAVKRIVVMVMSLALLSGALGTAEAAKDRRVERTVQGSYRAYPTPVTGCNSVSGPWACLIVRTRPAEAFFSATVADAHGQPVLVNVYSQRGHLTTFCGRTRRPVAFAPGATLSFDVGQGRAPFTAVLPCPQRIVKTTGTIRVTLSNRR